MDLGSKSPKQWICREWVRKLGSNESDEHLNRFRWQEGVNKQGNDEEKTSSAMSKENRSCIYCSSVRLQVWFLVTVVFLPSFGDPLSMVRSFYYIALFKWSWSFTCCPSRPPLECLSHRTSPQTPLCIGAANIVLFRDLLHINAVWKLAAKLLMR